MRNCWKLKCSLRHWMAVWLCDVGPVVRCTRPIGKMQMLKLHRKKNKVCVWASHFSPFTCNLNPSLAAMWKASMVCLTASSVAFGKERMDRMPGVISDGKPNESSRFLGINQLQLITSLMVNRFLGSTVRRPCVVENSNNKFVNTHDAITSAIFFFFCSCYLIVTRNLISHLV